MTNYVVESNADITVLTETWLKIDGQDQNIVEEPKPKGYEIPHEPRSTGFRIINMTEIVQPHLGLKSRPWHQLPSTQITEEMLEYYTKTNFLSISHDKVDFKHSY